MTGAEVKALIKSNGIKLWQVAEMLNMQDSNFSRRLRKSFNDVEVENIKNIIDELSKTNETTKN